MSQRPSRFWTDDDPEFASRVHRIAYRLIYETSLPPDTDPLDLAAAKLLLKWRTEKRP